MVNTKKEIIILGLKIFLMAIILLLLPIWTFFYFLIGIPSVILAEFVENITGLYLMSEITMIFFIPLLFWLIAIVKNDKFSVTEGESLFRNFQIIILTILLVFPIAKYYILDKNFYVGYFSMLLPILLILILANRREIKRLLN